jgi:hypothetical protein
MPVNRSTYQMPPALSPAEVKKLIEKRNERFKKAVDEYVAFLGIYVSRRISI